MATKRGLSARGRASHIGGVVLQVVVVVSESGRIDRLGRLGEVLVEAETAGA